MRIKFLRRWRGFTVGKVSTDFPDGAANVLIRQGYAEAVKKEKRKRVPRNSRIPS